MANFGIVGSGIGSKGEFWRVELKSHSFVGQERKRNGFEQKRFDRKIGIGGLQVLKDYFGGEWKIWEVVVSIGFFEGSLGGKKICKRFCGHSNGGIIRKGFFLLDNGGGVMF